MSDNNSNEPAFPVVWEDDSSRKNGMSLRTYAAIKAMQALISTNIYMSKGETTAAVTTALAKASIIIADEILKQLNKTSTPNLLQALSRISNCTDLATAQEYANEAIKKATN